VSRTKVIFLDMDGVMNSRQSSYWYRKMMGHEEDEWVNYRAEDTGEFNNYEKQLCPLACGNLRNLLEYHPDARIVISSTWRRGREVDWFNRLFKHFKIFKKSKVIGKTPSLNTERGFEIKHWLDNTVYDVSEFVILDDDGDMGPYCGTKNFVQTSSYVGFDYFKMEEVDKLFGKFILKYKELKQDCLYMMYSKPRDTHYFMDGEGMAYFNEDGTKSNNVFMYKDFELFAEVVDAPKK